MFDGSNYPPPWPLVPFTFPTPPLQKRIPFHLLPQKLIVHDPWNILSVDDIHTDSTTEWTAKRDIVRTYKLQLSSAAQDKIRKEEKARADIEAQKKDSDLEGVVLTDGTNSPPILVTLPAQPPPPDSIAQGHLYLSPAHKLGTGNHSVVYEAEWELPRSMLVQEILCRECMLDNLESDLEKVPVGDEPASSDAGGSRTSADDISASSSELKAEAGAWTTEQEVQPALKVQLVKKDIPTNEELDDKGILGSAGSASDSKGKGGNKNIHTVKPAVTVNKHTYEGPVCRVSSSVQWQNPERAPYCSHSKSSRCCQNIPLTGKVQVAAKLSFQFDDHLQREAGNYQTFPSHLFEHWNGYNLIPPLHEPVPVGAVAPQFYGYYVPEENDQSQYLSPVMLLEDCGTPIDPMTLGIDDRYVSTIYGPVVLLRMFPSSLLQAGNCLSALSAACCRLLPRIVSPTQYSHAVWSAHGVSVLAPPRNDEFPAN